MLAVADRHGEAGEARRAESVILGQVAAIEHDHELVMRSLLVSSTIVSAREAFGCWWRGLLESSKVLALFADNTPSYERAPVLLMELLSFLAGCYLLHKSDEDDELLYAAAFRQGFLAMCQQVLYSFPSALRETIILCVGVLPAQWIISSSFDNLHIARGYREALQRKIIRDGVSWVSPESRCLVDVHRAIHLSEAAIRALTRFSQTAVVEEVVVSLETYGRELTVQSDAIRQAPQEPNDRSGDFEVGAASPAASASTHQPSTRRMPLFEVVFERSGRAANVLLTRARQTMSDTHEVLSQRKREAREKRLISLGSLTHEEIHAFMYEDRLVAALPLWWQRQMYTACLRQSQFPTLPHKRSSTKHSAFISFFIRFRGIVLCAVYVFLMTSFVFAFHLRQNSQRGRSQNANVSVVAIANTAIEITIVTPLFLLVRLAVIPTIAKRVLRRSLKAALKKLEDTSRQSRSSSTDGPAFGPTLLGLSKAKKKLLYLKRDRSSDAAQIDPVDDKAIELSEIDPTKNSDDDGVAESKTEGVRNPMRAGDGTSSETAAAGCVVDRCPSADCGQFTLTRVNAYEPSAFHRDLDSRDSREPDSPNQTVTQFENSPPGDHATVPVAQIPECADQDFRRGHTDLVSAPESFRDDDASNEQHDDDASDDCEREQRPSLDIELGDIYDSCEPADRAGAAASTNPLHP